MMYQNITELIGNTPLLRIDPKIHRLKNVELYAKLEYLNPFGSVKDRTSWGMLRDHIDAIQDKQQTIIESSSGNTAKALQLLASIHGVPFKTITNRIKVGEQKGILKVLGAEIEELPGSSDCHDPFDPNDPVLIIQREIQRQGDKVFFTSQYDNPQNLEAHYLGTGEEILQDLPRVDYLFGGLGTTGSTRGTSARILVRDPQLKTIGICATSHDYIPGIRNKEEMWEVGLFDVKLFDSIRYITSQSAIDGMLTLARRAGVLGGPTSGACYEGALQYLREIDDTLTEKKVAVFVVCDRLEWYLSYIRERRPELFETYVTKDSIEMLTAEEIELAPEIPVENATTWIEEQHPLVIDIRGHQSFHVAHIAGSTNIPDLLFRQLIEGARPFSPTQKILLVCPKGEQSKKYAAYLTKKGYEAFNLAGGLVNWRQKNLPLESLICCDTA